MASSEMHVPWLRRLGYGVGDFGLVLSWQLAAIFLLFFSTEVLGLNPAVAGTIVLIGLLFDGVADVTVGVLADRWRQRLGGYRIWLAAGVPFLACGTVLLFWAPPLTGTALLVALVAIHLAFRLAYAVVAIPYGALSSAMTPDSRERGALVGVRQVFATIATLAVALSAQPLVNALGQGDTPRGFFLAALVFALVGALAVLVAWAAARERIGSNEASASAYKLSELAQLVFANSAFLRVAACQLCFALGSTAIVSGAPYFFSHVRNAPETLGPSLGVLIGGMVVFLPVWIALSWRIGKRVTWIVGAVWSAIALVGLSQLIGASLPVFLGAMAVAAFGFAAIQMTSFSMLPDTVEYGEWKSGVKVEAALYSALILVQKIAAGLAAWTVGLGLSWAGHSSATPMTGTAAAAFGSALFLVPAGVILFSLFAIWRYPISTAFHAQLHAEIEVRRKAA